MKVLLCMIAGISRIRLFGLINMYQVALHSSSSLDRLQKQRIYYVLSSLKYLRAGDSIVPFRISEILLLQYLSKDGVCV